MISCLASFGFLFFPFSPESISENFQFQNFSEFHQKEDVIIIFNSGGWGNTPLKEAEDFAPIIKGVQETLASLGYNSLVVPYKRTKDGFLGKVEGMRDLLNSFNFSSQSLVKEIEFLREKSPDAKIIVAGLSSGAALAEETMKNISQISQIYAIELGIPFWIDKSKTENILRLDNHKKDSLVVGKKKVLLTSFIKSPFRWVYSKINGEELAFSETIQAPGHEYFWSSPEVGPQITAFLENKFR